jgi:hypothetical protein
MGTTKGQAIPLPSNKNRNASTVSLPSFPSVEHKRMLKDLAATNRGLDISILTDECRRQWHAYDYGWRRVYLQTRDDISPIDHGRVWFDDNLAAEAEIFWCRVAGKKAPNLVDPKKARLTYVQWEKHRNSLAPLWDLVRRGRQGENVEYLLAERCRITAETFAADPEIERVNAIIGSAHDA